MSESLFDLLTQSGESDRIYGVVTGVVTNNEDPEKLGRVRVRFPWLSNDDESWWARLAVPMAGKGRGTYFLPEVDDEVLVAFERGDTRLPYVIGALWSSEAAPPETNDGKNNPRSITSRSGMVIRLDDNDGKEQIVMSDKDGKTSLLIDVAESMITISADADITITSASGKLTLSGAGVAIESQADIKLKAGAGLALEASGNTTIKGAMVEIN